MTVKYKFIFLDNNVLCELTKQTYYEKLVSFIKRKGLYLLISDILLLESFNPKPEGNDRTERFSKLFSDIDFLISSHTSIWEEEVEAYPKISNNLPYTVISDIIPEDTSKEDKKSIFQMLYKSKSLHQYVDLPKAANLFLSEKKNAYPNGIKKIIDDAFIKELIVKTENCFKKNNKHKEEFLWGMDLRLCENIVKLFQYKKYSEIPASLLIYLDKLKLLIKNMDSYKLRGIHLTSLAFWYEYIKQSKKINSSDLGDFLNLSFIPYCDYAVLDKSRIDMLQQIFKSESNIDYSALKYFDLKSFAKNL